MSILSIYLQPNLFMEMGNIQLQVIETQDNNYIFS